MILSAAIGVVMHAGSLRVEAAWTLLLVNQTGTELTLYDVNPSPPPSRLPAGTIPSGGTFSIDPSGFNQVFAWDAGISMTGTDPNGFFIALGLTDSPPLIQYKRFHYKVTPGEAGADPSLQPILVSQQVVEVTEGTVVIVVDAAWNATFGSPTGPGVCCALAGCSDVTAPGLCLDGNFFGGISCSPGFCTYASKIVGPGGGTVETPNGAVSVTFPPDCLSTSTMISLEAGDHPSRLYDIALIEGPGVDFDVYLAYVFEPDGLDFCPEAELCMTIDRAALGIDPAACSDIQFLHKDRFCRDDPNSVCQTDADCPPDKPCATDYHVHATTCTCPPASSNGTRCGNIGHFSDYILVEEVGEGPQHPDCEKCCCAPGLVLLLPLMFAILGLAKARGAGVTRHRG